MDFFEIIRNRRSFRKFTSEAVPPQVIQQAIDAAILAPNSSNMQPWEFYGVRSSEARKSLVKACLSQGAAASAAELIVVVARIDTWRRNRAELLKALSAGGGQLPKQVNDYYNKVVPLAYTQDVFGFFALAKKLIFTAAGFFGPTPRTPTTRAELFEVVTKSTALACENLMLALVAQGFDCCPMEGFDEVRVKRLLGVGRQAHVTMVIGVGKGDPKGLYGERFRVDRSLVVREI